MVSAESTPRPPQNIVSAAAVHIRLPQRAKTGLTQCGTLGSGANHSSLTTLVAIGSLDPEQRVPGCDGGSSSRE
jgi:hypothetical protein